MTTSVSQQVFYGGEGRTRTYEPEGADLQSADFAALLLPHLLFTLLERYIGIEPTSFRWQRNILTVILIPHLFW